LILRKLKLRVPTQLEPFPNGTAERIAGVNSFGFGGANAHVIWLNLRRISRKNLW
jgi:Polyketide synthase modules and related proteins